MQFMGSRGRGEFEENLGLGSKLSRSAGESDHRSSAGGLLLALGTDLEAPEFAFGHMRTFWFHKHPWSSHRRLGGGQVIDGGRSRIKPRA